MAIPTDKDQRLTEAELLNTPEQNLPVALAATLRARREAVKQKKDTVLFEQNELRQSAHARHDHENSAYEHQLILETFHAAMRDIEYREDLLLKQIDREERRVRKRLQDIDDRAIKLRDGRRAYVGANGDYIDEQGKTLQGSDADDARRKHRDSPNAATWTERRDAKDRYDTTLRMRQDILDGREERSRQDKDSLSDSKMKSRIIERSADLARMETEFHDKFQTASPYGSDNYMDGFETADDMPASKEPKAGLGKEFTPAAQGQESQTARATSRPEGPPHTKNLAL